MSADSTMHVRSASRLDGYLDWAQMLTGAALVLFMWSHMILVSSVILGQGVMNGLAWFFEATYMAQVGGPMIGLTMIAHFILAARKMPFRVEQQQHIWKQARMLNHQDTWLWLVQVGTAFIVLIMGLIHMYVVLTDLPITAIKSASRIRYGGWLWFYLILLPMVELHVAVGFYRIGVKWGFITRANRENRKKKERWLFTAMMIIGLVTLIRFWTLV